MYWDSVKELVLSFYLIFIKFDYIKSLSISKLGKPIAGAYKNGILYVKEKERLYEHLA